ncbi:MAG: hypothetical protein MK060_20770 [Blastomonas sp.]|uniref:hypothetical protein n=1 Tax=Blastomonas sp. TaxID=1909299 RepID=UPI00406A9EF8|nr:hypothetical protein [Blastomonas sp.]
MQILTLGGACGEHFSGVLGRVPRPHEQIDFTEVLLLPVGEANLISDEAIFMLEIVADPTDPHALVVENIGASLRTEVGTRDVVYITLDLFTTLDRMENRHSAATVDRRLQFPYALLPRQSD